MENLELYNQLSDEDLVVLSKDDEYALECLVVRYKNFVKSKARPYFLIGSDREDIIQEGMIGLYKAIRDYVPKKNVAFRIFADLCTTRQIISAVKASTRQKHIPMNSYISLDKPMNDDATQRTLLDIISNRVMLDPQEIVVREENNKWIESKIAGTLTELEASVLELYLSGNTYKEISLKLGKQTKAIDNAIQRVKKKIEKFTKEINDKK